MVDRSQTPPMLLLAAFGAITPLSVDMYLSSWPTMAEFFHCTIGDMQLSLSSFFIGFASGQLFYGPLSDSLGRRPMVFLGVALYLVGTALCLVTTDIHFFIGLRLIQGLGACAPPIMARAIVRDRFERDAAARMFSLLMIISLMAPLVAPMLGGYLLTSFGWRSLFWVLTGVGVALTLVTLWLMPETLSPARRRRLAPLTVMAGYVSLVRHRRYMGFTLAGTFIMAGLFAYVSSASYLLVTVAHISPELFGYYFAVNIVGQALFAFLNSHLVGRVGSERMLRFGLWSGLAMAAIMVPAAYFGSGWFGGVALPLAAFLATMALVSGNSVACSLVDFPSLAGTGAALSGFLLFLMGSGMAALMSRTQNGTTIPLALTVLACAVAAIICYLGLVRPWQVVPPDAPEPAIRSAVSQAGDEARNIVAE